MKKKARLLLLLCLPSAILSLMAPAAAPAAVDMFLDLEGIPGESQADKFKGQIDVLAWSWGVSNPGPVTTIDKKTTTTTNGVRFQDISFTHYIDRSSPRLFSHVASGEVIGNAVLTVRKAGQFPFTQLKICMSGVRATSMSTGGSGGEDRLTENISLGYGAIAMWYQQQNATGTALGAPITAGWNVVQGLATGVTGCQ